MQILSAGYLDVRRHRGRSARGELLAEWSAFGAGARCVRAASALARRSRTRG